MYGCFFCKLNIGSLIAKGGVASRPRCHRTPSAHVDTSHPRRRLPTSLSLMSWSTAAGLRAWLRVKRVRQKPSRLNSRPCKGSRYPINLLADTRCYLFCSHSGTKGLRKPSMHYKYKHVWVRARNRLYILTPLHGMGPSGMLATTRM